MTASMELPSTADAVVIGAGAFGCSAAHRLATAGLSTVLLDRFEPGSQTSPRAAGNTKQIRPQEVLSLLAIDSVRMIERFSEETGVGLPYHQTGSLHFARTEEEASRGRGEIAAGMKYGVPVTEVDSNDLAGLTSFARSEGVLLMWYSAQDLYLDPRDLLSAYLEAASRSGCVIVGNCPVTRLDIRSDRIGGVDTSLGHISSPVVIDAAGAWSRMVAQRAGVDIPLVPMRHQVFVTDPTEHVSATDPICRVLDAGVYMRPCEGGLMFGGFESAPQVHDMQMQPDSFQIEHLDKDEAVLDSLAATVAPQFPMLSSLRVKELRAGLPTLTPDNLPIVGPVGLVEGFIVASGCCVGGLSISPSVGSLLAEMVIRGDTSIPIQELYLDRFSGVKFTTRQLIEKCRDTYSGFYVKEHG